MNNQGTRIRNIILFALGIIWVILHFVHILFDVIKHSRK
jgi:hypothetical protein